jgi:hypothetical protein
MGFVDQQEAQKKEYKSHTKPKERCFTPRIKVHRLLSRDPHQLYVPPHQHKEIHLRTLQDFHDVRQRCGMEGVGAKQSLNYELSWQTHRNDLEEGYATAPPQASGVEDQVGGGRMEEKQKSNLKSANVEGMNRSETASQNGEKDEMLRTQQSQKIRQMENKIFRNNNVNKPQNLKDKIDNIQTSIQLSSNKYNTT